MKMVHTQTGSVYLLNQEEGTCTRYPSAEGLALRKDGETLPLIDVAPIVIGEPLVMLLDVVGDGIKTVRTTTAVTNVEEVHVDESPPAS